MKAVLISIRPEWTRLILSGQKTVEIRKSKPKLQVPFKCYIYQTLPKSGDWNERDGHVIGEFVCDKIFDVFISSSDPNLKGYPFPGTGLTDREIMDYLGNGKCVYGWHISELKVYNEPKKLSEFTPCCKFMLDEKQCDYRKVKCLNQQDSFIEEDGCNCLNFVRRPPMSWCYVESLEGGTDNA